MGPNENMGPTQKFWYHQFPSMRGENWIWIETGNRFDSGLDYVQLHFPLLLIQPTSLFPFLADYDAAKPILLSSEIPKWSMISSAALRR